MFPVVPEPWPRYKVELENAGKHVPRRLARGSIAELPRVKLRRELNWGQESPVFSGVPINEESLSSIFLSSRRSSPSPQSQVRQSAREL